MICMARIFGAPLTGLNRAAGYLFQADGLCTTEYDPILGLSIPQWALVWFTIFALITAAIAVTRKRGA